MKLATLLVPIVALAAAACGGYGYTYTTGAYVDDDVGPGVDVDTYPVYTYDNDRVYEVHGRYWRRHGNHWWRYNERPEHMRYVGPGRGHEEHEHFEHHHDHHD